MGKKDNSPQYTEVYRNPWSNMPDYKPDYKAYGKQGPLANAIFGPDESPMERARKLAKRSEELRKEREAAGVKLQADPKATARLMALKEIQKRIKE
jgi:hypothetical protein